MIRFLLTLDRFSTVNFIADFRLGPHDVFHSDKFVCEHDSDLDGGGIRFSSGTAGRSFEAVSIPSDGS